MKTARFASIVEKIGRPEVYLALIDPAHDRALQAAEKANRVMTVAQESVGQKADRGKIGFEAGPHRQFLIFPKSLKAFAGQTVVGIKYELLEDRESPISERTKAVHAPRKGRPKQKRKPEKPARETLPSPKVIPFKHEAEREEEEENEHILEMKKQIRRAMALLEEGKAVAAFNLLKRIVED